MDGLRFTYLLECSEAMRRANERFREACWDENHEAARAWFDAMAAIGKDMRDTLAEIEAAEKRDAKEAA